MTAHWEQDFCNLSKTPGTAETSSRLKSKETGASGDETRTIHRVRATNFLFFKLAILRHYCTNSGNYVKYGNI